MALVMLASLASVNGASAQSTEPTAQELVPDSPMAEMPDIGVDWPDMQAQEAELPSSPDEAAEAAQRATEIVGERRYRIVIEGLDLAGKSSVIERFNSVSTLKAGEGKPANVAQIDRRAREDADLLSDVLRAEGYYDANVETSVEAGDPRQLVVTLRADPGPIYRFSQVQVTGLEETGAKSEELRNVFAVNPKDAVDADTVVQAETDLANRIKQKGFPFAKVSDPEVLVDHDARTATLTMHVEPGGERKFGAIVLTGNKLPFDAKHVGRISRFKTGEVFDQSKLDDLRRALVATGLVSQVRITPVPASDPVLADVAVVLEPAKMRTIAAEAGYSTGEGIRAEVSWTHRNLIRPEGAVTFRGVAGTREQYLGAILRQSNFRARDQVLNANIYASKVNRTAYEARTLGLGLGFERQTNIIWQKKWTWSLGTELLASRERDSTKIANAPRKTFFIAAFPGTLNYDGSDDLLDPSKGFRIGLRLSPEVSRQSGTFTYARAQFDGSYYLPAGNRVVLAGRVRVGSILGAGTQSIAPSRRFYSGGGGSVRGYGYQLIGPRDAANTPIGGRSLTEFAVEARIRLGSFGIVPFLDGGNVYTSPMPKFSKFRLGTGIGARYYSSFGPIRIDVGTPLNRQTGDSRITVAVSLGQAF
ncbi:autotransporter assembly complex protein TamA [Aquisediminimonas profunda]|uniref:autotransporter assembly complex protein TamA n=1 Tax=Aquisediminimonas profunda TaxID=1550733 RepID=UPI001FEA2D71|nr:BamA/TamA family outer membrane protein [Aquisediminimonas profunda]